MNKAYKPPLVWFSTYDNWAKYIQQSWPDFLCSLIANCGLHMWAYLCVHWGTCANFLARSCLFSKTLLLTATSQEQFLKQELHANTFSQAVFLNPCLAALESQRSTISFKSMWINSKSVAN